MTCNTSAVAVCCSKASRVSVISRAFSIAMTACAAKFSKQRDLLVGERPHLLAVGDDQTEQDLLLAQRNDQNRTHRIEAESKHLAAEIRLVDRLVAHVGDLD